MTEVSIFLFKVMPFCYLPFQQWLGLGCVVTSVNMTRHDQSLLAMHVPDHLKIAYRSKILLAFQLWWGRSSNAEMGFLTCETNIILNMYLSVHLCPATLYYYVLM